MRVTILSRKRYDLPVSLLGLEFSLWLLIALYVGWSVNEIPIAHGRLPSIL
jgi:hypothetical protein